MLVLTEALEPDNPSLVDDHGAERRILLVVPNPIGICHVANGCGNQRKGDSQILPDAPDVAAVAAAA